MSIDLVLWATNKTALTAWGNTNPPNRPLREQVVETPAILDAEGAVVMPATYTWQIRRGLEFSWWAGTGKLMTAAGTYDAKGTELTAPAYAPGVMLLLRIYGEFFDADTISEGTGLEPWKRSRVAKYIQNNGTSGTLAGLTYYEVDGVRLFRYTDVMDWCRARGVPWHEFL